MHFLKKLFGRDNSPSLPPYSLPEGELVYAIGDVHGRFDLLQKLMGLIETDRAERPEYTNAKIIFLGDYLDRGLQSKEVLDWLINVDIDWAEVVTLKGNHEAMALEFMQDPVSNGDWLFFGGMEMLASYGIRVRENEVGDRDLIGAVNDLTEVMPQSHVDFLKALPVSHQSGDYYFVHAGLRPSVPVAEQTERDQLFIRQEYTESDVDFGVRVVHGHTGVQNPINERRRVAVDTTAYATGRLTAAVLFGSKTEFITT